MVIQDLTNSFSVPSLRKNKIAPVTDRLLAVFFDFVLFTPIFTLLFSQLFRRLEVRYYTSPESTEFLVLFAITVLGLAFTTILTQAFFLTKFGYTPGKYIFKLRVVSLESADGKVNFTQALLRSGLWVFEFFMLCVPFVELFSHVKRQPLHDRAASTLVVTLKAQGDQGPHPLETHFVRNFLFLFVCVFMFWGAVVTTELYRMALRGDFKKQELDSEQYLCQSVSLFAKKETNRLDLALARYMAKEVDEDCLLNEADFALWTDHSPQRAWAYFAKGIYSQFDQDQTKEYFQKTCSVDERSEACDMAKALLGEKTTEHDQNEKRKKESLTAKVLEIKELKARGLFEQAQNRITELTKQSKAFESFSQIERTQNLIGLGKIDEAKGAYENTWSHMAGTHRQHFSSWYCLEELDLKCESQNYQGCDNLKSELQNNGYDDVNAEAVVALLSENECKKSNDLNMLALHFAIDADENLKKFVMAVSSDSNWNREAKISALRELAFDHDGVGRFLQRRAMISLLEKSQQKSDFEKIAEILESTKVKDWTMQKVAGILMITSEKSGFLNVASRASKLVPANYAKMHQLQQYQKDLRLPASSEEEK